MVSGQLWSEIITDLRITLQLISIEVDGQQSRRGQMKVNLRSRGGELHAPPTKMKILHVTTTTSSGESDASNSSGFKSYISSSDLKNASAVLIEVEGTSLGDERRIQRQRESPAASVSSVSSVSAISADDRYQETLLLPSGEGGRPMLPARPSIPPRRAGGARSRARRPRAASPGERRPGRVMDGGGDAVMRGAGRDTSATCCSTSATAAETAPIRALVDDVNMSRDLPVGSQLTRRHGDSRRRRSCADVTRQCRCRNTTSGIAAERKFRPHRKHFDADDAGDCSRSVTVSAASLQRLPDR